MPETTSPTVSRETLHAEYLRASLEGRYQDAVDFYRAFAGCTR